MATQAIPVFNHSFKVGDALTLTYAFVVPRPYPGKVIKVTPSAIYVTFDHDPEPSRFFIKGRQWRDQFGGAVFLEPLVK